MHVGQTVVYIGTDNLERKASVQAVLANNELDLQVDGFDTTQSAVVYTDDRVAGEAVWRAAVTPTP